MASSRRVIHDISGVGRIKVSKKNPEALYLEIGFLPGKPGKWRKVATWKQCVFVPVRDLSVEDIQRVIVEWITPDYEMAVKGERRHLLEDPLDEEGLRLALDLCYKELARRA